jgi:hypothetical protein
MLTTAPTTLAGVIRAVAVAELDDGECAAFAYSQWCEGVGYAGADFLLMVADD